MRGKSRNSQAGRLGVEPRKTGRDHPCPSCPIRVLTAHGHDLVRLGVGAMPEEEKDIVVVGESRRRAGAISQVPRVKPDVVLIQPHSPGESDDTRSHLLRDADSGIRLVVIAMPCTSSRFNRVADRGACGHEIEEMSRLELLRVIRLMVKCEPCVSWEKVARTVTPPRKAADSPKESRLQELSPQERRMMPLVADGKTNQQIAMELALSPKTVKNYMANMFKKLQIARRAQAAALYMEDLKSGGHRSVFHGKW